MVAGFYPGSFSVVMATGIVSIAALQQQMNSIAVVLFVANQVAYAAMILLTVLRGVLSPGDVLADISSPSQAPGLFTLTAATCILGSQMLFFPGTLRVGIILSCAGLLFWAVLSYAFFAAIIVKQDKTAGEETLRGEWLIYVVGTQSMAITGILLTAHFDQARQEILLAALFLHFIGVAVYFTLIVLIARRMMFLDLPPDR